MSKVIYDALSITSKIHAVYDFIELLGFESVVWENVKGAHGYKDRLYWNCISIHYNGSEDMGIWLELTGQGCRAFETYGSGNYELLFGEVMQNPGEMKITRLDVAYDDEQEAILDIVEVCKDTRLQEYISKFSEWQVIEGSKGSSVTHGSMKSDLFIRIYDKAMERGFTDGRHWVRVELQLRRERAIAFIMEPGEIGGKFAGVLGNYLRYVEPNQGDENRWRWLMKPYWDRLLAGAARIRLYEKPGAEYNMMNLDNFVFKQAGNAIDTAMQIYTLPGFEKKLKDRGIMRNPKYDRLIAEYGRNTKRSAAAGDLQENCNTKEIDHENESKMRPPE